MPTLPEAAITVQQPYGALLAAGIKTVETRAKPTSYRGELFLHISKAPHWSFAGLCSSVESRPYLSGLLGSDSTSDNLFKTLYSSLPLGVIVGRIRIVDCLPAEALYSLWMNQGRASDWQREDLLGDLSGVTTSGNRLVSRFAYLVEPVEIWPEPIPARGQLGIYRTEKLNPGILEKIRLKYYL